MPSGRARALGDAAEAGASAIRILALEWDLLKRAGAGRPTSKRLERLRRRLLFGREGQEYQARTTSSERDFVRLYADDLTANAVLIDELAEIIAATGRFETDRANEPLGVGDLPPDEAWNVLHVVAAAQSTALLALARYLDKAAG